MNKSKRNVHKTYTERMGNFPNDRATSAAADPTHDHVKSTTETSKTNLHHRPSRCRVK